MSSSSRGPQAQREAGGGTKTSEQESSLVERTLPNTWNILEHFPHGPASVHRKARNLSPETSTFSTRGAPRAGALGRRPAGARGVWRPQESLGALRPRPPSSAGSQGPIYPSFYDANSMHRGRETPSLSSRGFGSEPAVHRSQRADGLWTASPIPLLSHDACQLVKHTPRWETAGHRHASLANAGSESGISASPLCSSTRVSL